MKFARWKWKSGLIRNFPDCKFQAPCPFSPFPTLAGHKIFVFAPRDGIIAWRGKNPPSTFESTAVATLLCAAESAGMAKNFKDDKSAIKSVEVLPRARSTMPVALLLVLRCYNERRNEDSVKVPIQFRDFLIVKPHRHRRIRSDGALKM